MKKHILWIGAGVTALVLSPLLLGCETTRGDRHHHMAYAQAQDHELGCQLCFDETIRARRTLGGKQQWPGRHEVIRQHMCPDCEGDMQIYTQDGVLMIKCSQCAPEGVPCNLCLPPETDV